MPGSPAIIKNGNQIRSVAGAFTLMGDANNDRHITDFDQNAMLNALTGPGVQAPLSTRINFDFDCDGDIDDSDLAKFVQVYEGENPAIAIPAVSEWGALILGLATAAGGAAVLRRRQAA